jgi:ferrous iron transport protein B
MPELADPPRRDDLDAGARGTAPRVALIGNPNTGKTSLFNALTGLRQRVGNYPGVTVEKKVGVWKLPGGREVELVDLPGTYSLSANSLDERVAVDVLSGHLPGEAPPDVIVVVVDAGNLRRNLFLASQAAELGRPIVIAVNLWDVAERKGILIDCKLLEQRLGVPVVPTVATRRGGADDLAAAIAEAAGKRPMMRRPDWPEAVTRALASLHGELVEKRGEALNEAELQRLLFDKHTAIKERLASPVAEVEALLREVREGLYKDGYQPDAAESILRFRFLGPLLEDIVQRQEIRNEARSRTESIDRIMLHRFWGLAIFVAMMYVVFQAVYTWAGPMMDGIEAAKGAVQERVAPLLEGTPMLQSLVVDGAIEGVGAFVVFLPQILILFLFIALLEESGYMSRAAFLMDKLFHWCGLNGKSFVPLLSSYACAIPGILATRTIGNPKARLITIMAAPFMSCSARLPVYLLLIGAFVEPAYGPAAAGFTLFVMHFVGLLVAAPVAWVLKRLLRHKAEHSPFLLEMPPYRPPRLRSVLWRVAESGKDFVVRAGTIIFAMTLVVWALLYFPRPDALEESMTGDFIGSITQGAGLETGGEIRTADSRQSELEKRVAAAYLAQSYMGRFGKALQPVFDPAGFDWKITVGVLASFPAREVIISTLGVIYSLGGEVDEESPNLRTALAQARWEEGPRQGQPVFNLPVALAIMVFFALCMQCGSTLAVIASELNWRWAVASFVLMTALAWTGAVATYQIGMLFTG